MKEIKETPFAATRRKFCRFLRYILAIVFSVFAGIPSAVLIRLIRPFIVVRFGAMMSLRIGHFVSNTEVWLSKEETSRKQQRTLNLFYCRYDSVCNRYLLKMWKRVLHLSTLYGLIAGVSRLLPGHKVHEIRLDSDRAPHGELDDSESHLIWTKSELSSGQQQLAEIGVSPETPFIFLLSRDSSYLSTVFQTSGYAYHNYRDSKVESFALAAEELASMGYCVLRCGAVVSSPFDVDNPRVIDYANQDRSEFMDVYLGAHCAFYLGDHCGADAVASAFRRPMCITNMVPMEYAPTWDKQCVWIPKKLWLIDESRFLRFSEIFSSGLGKALSSHDYEALGVEPVSNTPEEIRDAAIEMHQRIVGKWQSIEENDRLQERFWSLFPESELNVLMRSHIGASFLRNNQELLS